MHFESLQFLYTNSSPAVAVMMELIQLYHLMGSFRPLPPLHRGDIMMLFTIHYFSCKQSKNVRVSNLARLLQQSPPRISQRIHLLQQKGFVFRTEDKNDRRASFIKLTTQGKQVLEETLQNFLHTIRFAVDGMDSHETQQFLHTLRHVRTSIEGSSAPSLEGGIHD